MDKDTPSRDRPACRSVAAGGSPAADKRAFRAFLTAARGAIARELYRSPGRAPADALRAEAQAEVLDLLLARAGHRPRGGSSISDALRGKLAARLLKINLPYDFLGAAHLDHLSCSIDLVQGEPRVLRNVSRKSSGSYYTPHKIVRRITLETVARALQRAQNVREASRLRVVDMACGSGVFLLEAAEEIRRFYAQRGMQEGEAAALAAGQVIGADVSADAAEVAKLTFDIAGFPEPKVFIADALRDDCLRWQEALPDVFREGGFDVIVGNPPYGAAARLDPETKRTLANGYNVYAGHGDLHYCFFERGLSLLRPGGLLGLLTSAYFLQASHAAKLRALLARQSRIETIIDCSREDLFPDAAIHCVITVVSKGEPPGERLLRFEPAEGRPFVFPQGELSAAPWVVISDSERRWRAKLERDAVPLGTFCEIVQGPESGLNEAFAVSAEYAREAGLEQELLRPLIKNSDIDRYAVAYRDSLMIYIPRGTRIERHPAAMRHLEKYRDRLAAREVCRTSPAPWFAFHRPRSALLMNAPRKIVCPYRAPGNRFAVDERGALNDGGDVRMIFPKRHASISLYFLAAVLNSHVMGRYFSHMGRRKGTMLEFFKDSLKMLPIRIIPSDHPVYSTLADLAALQHEQFSQQRDYLVERIVLDLYELKAAAAAPRMLF